MLEENTFKHEAARPLSPVTADRHFLEQMSVYCLLRSFLKSLKSPASIIPSGSMREHQWPEGIVVSISHDDDFAVAAVGRSGDIALLGIDLAGSGTLQADLADVICRKEDFVNVSRNKEFLADLDPYKLVFSIKEVTYKCLFPVVRTIFDFHDIAVDFKTERGKAAIVLRNRDLFANLRGELEARYTKVGKYLFTAVWKR
jgi:4'-phosphopantetheinyl transferase EntD